MQKIIEAIRENLALAYQKAIDCDAMLEQLKEQGHGQFSAIFSDGFNTKADRFLPYVEEVAASFYPITQLSVNQQNQLNAAEFSDIIKQLEIIFATQTKFQQTFVEDSQ